MKRIIALAAALMMLAFTALSAAADMLGDVNGNGAIDAADYAMAKRQCLGTYEMTAEELLRADINGNGAVDPTEYAMIKRHVLGTYTIEGEVETKHEHTPVTDKAVPASCTETGLTEGSHCSVCGEVIVAQEVVPALGHEPDGKGVCTRCNKDVTSKGLEYKLHPTEDAYIVTGIGTCTDTELVIPAEYDGWPVISIGEYAFGYDIFNFSAPAYDKNITKVFICEGVTGIDPCAFMGCTSLTSITIPDSVTSIGEFAFAGCKSLTSVTIGNGVTSIGSSAFNSCTSLTSVTIPDSVTSIGDGAFNYCTSLTSVTIPDSVTSIGSGAFGGCSGLTSVTIPDSVTSIGEYAFSGCTGLTSIDIPDSVTSIGSRAFRDCTGLTSITIPDSVTSIGDHIFEGCTGLTSITIPDSVTSIGDHAFEGCTSLDSIQLPVSDGVIRLYNDAFTNTAYYNDENNWDGNVLYIGAYLIEARQQIKGDYAVKQGTVCIADMAFDGCVGVSSIVLPEGLKGIGDHAFYGCTRLKDITVPDSVTSIGKSAFQTCTNLTSITIPDSVTSIGDEAFYRCTSLSTVYYTGTKEQWNQLINSIGYGNDPLQNATIVFNYKP